ncbi:MAG: DUF2244 domain-containing protein [Rhodobacteraceae bacterium]|nr:DUF2244 domain-containing protein [Paracoccaceae bacterium]
MPHAWVKEPEGAPERSGAFRFADGDPPAARLTLWPHRSLSPEGFVWFVGLTAGALALPLLSVLGSPVLWGLLPFVVLTLWGLWWAIRRNAQDGALTEELTLWRDRIQLVRREPRGRVRDWAADPYWVRVEMHESGGPVEKYLTLRGGGREVEIGAFLSPEERAVLRAELLDALARVR